MMASLETESLAVLFVHETYSTSKVEIFNINRQAGLIVREHAPGIIVYSTVLKETEEDIQTAEDDGVELLLPKCHRDDSRTPSIGWLTFDHRTRYPNLPPKIMSIVGYAGITGRAAARIREDRYPDAKLILFNTDIPEETEYYKGDEEAMGIGKKEESILEDAQKADVVFSLGDKVYDHFQNQFRAILPAQESDPRHFKFVPRPMSTDKNATYGDAQTKVVLFIGKVKGVEKVKGYDLAVESMKIVSKNRKVKLRVIGDSNDNAHISTTQQYSKLKITTIPYKLKDVYTNMMKSHLVLMPSRAEPFGLVGLEAIATGVPVLVSGESGLADFIRNYVPELHHSIVRLDESDDDTVQRWADSIEEMLAYCKVEFDTAARCKEKLLSMRYWAESHQQFIEACVNTGNGTSDGRLTDDGYGTQQSASVTKRKRSRSAAHIEEAKENVGPQKQARPPPMALSVQSLHTGHLRDTLTESNAKPHVDTDIQDQDMLVKYQALKELMVEYELKVNKMEGENQIKLLSKTAPFLSEDKWEEIICHIMEHVKQNGAEIREMYRGCVILFLDFESKPRFENFWGFYSSGKLSDTVADLLVTDETIRLDSGDQLVVRAMVLKEDYRAWRDFFEKGLPADTRNTVQAVAPVTLEPISIAVPLTDTDEPEEASHEQSATSQPTIHPEPLIDAFSTLQCSADTEDKEVQGAMAAAEAFGPGAHQGQVNLGHESSKGTDVNVEDKDGQTPVWVESKAGHAAKVEMLISKGADVNKPDKKGRTPLWVASQNGHVSTTEVLITNGADANMADKEGRTPVWVAAQNGHIPTIEMLISKGADINKADEEGRTPLWVAAQKDDNLSTVEMLINKGAEVNFADKEGRTPLWVASQNGCRKTVRLLISRDAKVNMADKHSQSPLWVAAQGGDLPTVESLISKGADVNTLDKDAQTPLWIASQEGHLPVVEMLLSNDADVNVEDKDGQPPLWIASQEGHDSVVDRLLRKGAKVNVADIDHRTPLSVAAQWGHTPVVKMLLSKGADVNKPDKHGRTPLWIAALKGHLSTVKMLLSEGADVNMADYGGLTPLWIALQFDQRSTAEVLRSYGATKPDSGRRRASFLLELIAIKERYMMKKGDDENVATKRHTVPTDVAKSMEELVF